MKNTISVFLLMAVTAYFLSCARKEVDTHLDESLTDALNQRSATGSYAHFILPESGDYAGLPNQDVKNPVTPIKVTLGKLLFFETGIGLQPNKSVSMSTYSCSSCHIPTRGFTAGRFQGVADGAVGYGESGEGRGKNPLYLGDEVDAQGARPLPVINTTFITNALWAGTFGSFGVNTGTESVWHQDTLVEINFQQLEGLEAVVARALIVHRQVVNKAVTDSLGYTQLFDEAFPEIPETERYSRKYAAFAIAAYFRTILTNQAPFQYWLKGDKTALSEQQKKGALLFFGKAGCSSCHNSPSLNALPHRFFALGVKDLYQSGYEVFRTGPTDARNLGRGGFTGAPDDMHKFKVPQLYNMKDIHFYFHGASKTSLKEVVDYFNAGVPENPDVDPSLIASQLRPLGLTEEEKADLVEFLENGLYDPNLARYMPTNTLSGNCFPNNDPISKVDMGCQ